jgi:hypothetical protein
LLAWLLLAAASAGLLGVSWGRWSDAIVDSGREWIVPDGLARGELLYRDVVYWFPPLTPYLHAALFRAFGSGFGTLVLAGILTALATIAALWLALRKVTGRREALLWCAVAVPALVFMPAGGGAIIGMGYRIWQAAALTLLAVGLAAKGRPTPAGALAAGLLSGLAGLCRTEWGLASLAACLLAMGVRRGWRGILPPWLAAAGGAAAVFGVVAGAFVITAGPEAVVGDGHLLLTGIPEETRRFLRNASGLRDWPGGALRMIHSASLFVAAWVLIEILAARGRGGPWLRSRWPWLAGAGSIVLLYGRYVGPWPMPAFSAAPLAGAVAAASGLSRRGPSAGALAAFGSLALVLSYRKPFSIADWPYVAPPLLFAIVAAAGLLRLARARAPAAVRRSLGAASALGLAALSAAFFVTRAVTYRQDTRVPVEGTSRLLHAEPARAAWLAGAARTIRESTGPDESLAVFPEGELLNFLAGRRNPMRHRLYLPGYLTEENESVILEELSRARPGAVVILNRSTGEYGKARFGEDYGRSIARWIASDYRLVAVEASAPTGNRLFLRRDVVVRTPGRNPVP